MSSELDREELNDQVHSLKRSAISEPTGEIDEKDEFEGTLQKNWDMNKVIMAFEIERVMMQRDEGYQMLQIAQQEREDIIEKCQQIETENQAELSKLVKNLIDL